MSPLLISPYRSVWASLTVVVIAAIGTAANPVSAVEAPWSQAAPMAQPHQAATATLLPNGKVLVVGSFSNLNTGAELYDPAADGWTPAGLTIVPRGLASATLLPSGRVLIAGGIASDTGHSTTRTEIYDPETNSWSSAASMAVQRSSHTATLLANGKVLVAGGQNASGYIATAELYDPTSDSWTMAARMDAGYASATATLLASGKVLLAGGGTLGDGRAELYDPATNRWSNAGTEGRIAETASRLSDGRVLITGPGGHADLYEPAANRWTATPSMLQDRVQPTATRLVDGRVLVAGGSTTIDGQQVWLTSAEFYDPGANRWSPAGCMGEARWEHTATLLPTNNVLVAGGSVPPNTLSTTELFNPNGAPATQPIGTCPTTSPGATSVASPQVVPSAAAASVPGVTAARAAADPVRGPSRLSAPQTPSYAVAGGLGAGLVLAAIGGGVYLWSRRRRRVI